MTKTYRITEETGLTGKIQFIYRNHKGHQTICGTRAAAEEMGRDEYRTRTPAEVARFAAYMASLPLSGRVQA